MVFDLWSAPAVSDLLEKHPDFEYRIHREFETIPKGYLFDFFRALDVVMAYLSRDSRTDWRKSWKSMLSDPSVVSEAQEAIKKALQEMPEDVDES